jgi:hypothetical protein
MSGINIGSMETRTSHIFRQTPVSERVWLPCLNKSHPGVGRSWWASNALAYVVALGICILALRVLLLFSRQSYVRLVYELLLTSPKHMMYLEAYVT